MRLFWIPLVALAFVAPLSAQAQDESTEDSAPIQRSESPAPSAKSWLVILDPGHGGQDLGARSSKSILEKSVTLKLAQETADRLNKFSNITVLLTREGELERSQLRRIETANSRMGDLFLGLHTGGGFAPQSRPAEIFIAENSKGAVSQGEWGAQNARYSSANQRLALKIAEQLEAIGSGKETRVVKTSAMMLEGLAMPAAILEPFDLSNPQDEILLEDNKYLGEVASAIARGVVQFLGIRGSAGAAEDE